MRPGGIFKRRPVVEDCDWEAFSKADWVEMYRDIYKQTHGEDSAALAWFYDARERLETLKANRKGNGR